jgi:predicted regulator of Ras-like GTPase activity (Roadblock/LC7/MglB family)
MGDASLLQLEAEKGRVCAVGRDGLVLIAVAEPRVNLGLLRVELLKARESMA